MMRINKCIILLIIIVLISLLSSCKRQKENENEKESWDNFYNTIEQIKQKNENTISQIKVSETKKKESRGTEIINGKITEIKSSAENEFLYSTEWPDYDTVLWDLYNSDIDLFYEDYLIYYDKIVESDNSGRFDSWGISEKINILIKTNPNLEDIKKQIINHKIIVSTQYRTIPEESGIKIISPNEVLFGYTSSLIMYKIYLNNPINKLKDWYHYLFLGNISNIEKNDNKVIVTIENSSIFIDEGI